jgi:hypothetical protein
MVGEPTLVPKTPTKKKEGEWVGGDMVKGTIEFKNGNVYVGQFKTNDTGQDQAWGRGKWTFKNGDYYEGQLKCGMFHGKGRLVETKNGAIQVKDGQWKDDKFLGA